MKKFACGVEDMLKQKLILYCELVSVMEKERDYIINMDIESLWSVCVDKKKIIANIGVLRKDILNLIKRDSFLSHEDITCSSLVQIIGKIPFSSKVKSKLDELVVEINLKKDELNVLSSENKGYVNEYLTVINDVMSTIVEFSNDRHYTSAGSSRVIAGSNHFINAEV